MRVLVLAESKLRYIICPCIGTSGKRLPGEFSLRSRKCAINHISSLAHVMWHCSTTYIRFGRVKCYIQSFLVVMHLLVPEVEIHWARVDILECDGGFGQTTDT
jgi:hypothetical protein